MKKYLQLTGCLLTAFCGITLSASGIAANSTTLAVLDFENNSFYDAAAYQPLSKGLAQIMITEIQSIESIRVVERQRLRELLDELKLSQSGLLSAESSVQVGKMLGAKYLVFGGYMVTMNKKIRIDVRVVEVETGLTLMAGEETGKVGAVLSLVKKLSNNLLRDIHIELTKAEVRRLKKAKTIKEEALLAYSSGVEREDNNDLKAAAAYYRQALKIDPDFEQAGERLKSLMQ